ncbi:MAG: S41 family peptidase [Paludibacter sp.]|nr:S41 family peptidase [Paludibacter sp.]
MRKYLIFIILIVTFLSCINDDEPKFTNTLEGNFDALWYIIDTRYCYLDYKNINWDSIKTVYKPSLAQVKNKYQLFDLFAQMLAELKDGHVNLISEFDFSRYWKWYTDYPDNFNSSIIYNEKYLGNNYRIAGGLRYAKIADKQVGYIYYGSFSSGFSGANIISIFQQFADCRGIIIDVRNNGGGTLTYAETLASYFFETDQTTGYICHKTGNGHSDFSEPLPIITKANTMWNRKVVVLTNRMSFSATNDFVCRMQYAPHAIIVGDNTGGGGGLPFSSELPIGWSVRFSSSPMFDRDMNQIENGIVPNIKIDLDTTDNHNDAIIDKAVELILE